MKGDGGLAFGAIWIIGGIALCMLLGPKHPFTAFGISLAAALLYHFLSGGEKDE